MTVHDVIVSMIGQLKQLLDEHKLPYSNDLFWRLSKAIQELEWADQATPEVRYGHEETAGTGGQSNDDSL